MKLSIMMKKIGFWISRNERGWKAYWSFLNSGDGYIAFHFLQDGQWYVEYRSDDYGNPEPEKRWLIDEEKVKEWIEKILSLTKKERSDYDKEVKFDFDFFVNGVKSEPIYPPNLPCVYPVVYPVPVPEEHFLY